MILEVASFKEEKKQDKGLLPIYKDSYLFGQVIHFDSAHT